MSDAPEEPKPEEKKTDDGSFFWRAVGLVVIGTATIVTGNIMLDRWREHAERRRRWRELAELEDEDL